MEPYPESYGEESEAEYQPPRWRGWIRWIIIGFFLIVIGLLVFRSALNFWLNIQEFGELFLKPFYLSIYGGLILSAIALFRLDFVRRRSIIWWIIRLIIQILKERGTIERRTLSFSSYTMSLPKFLAWQLTKVLIGIPLFSNLFFGIAISNMNLSLDTRAIDIIFSLPFKIPPFDLGYAYSTVITLIPGLTLIVGPLLGVISLRLITLVGFTELIRIFTPSRDELVVEEGRSNMGWRVSIVEALIGLAFIWTAFTRFVPSYIDYNTKYIIGFAIGGGILYFGLALNDRLKNVEKPAIFFNTRRIASRFLPLLLVGLLLGSIILVNNGIADSRKVEWLGPYTTQEIAVNRYLANLDIVKEVPYNFSIGKTPKDEIPVYIGAQRDIINVIRLWDWEAAFSKLKPEIGLIPYIDFQDSDIIRFNNTLYWSASMKALLPETVRPEDRWYATHFYYTHVPNGFFILDAHEGKVLNTTQFFPQRRIYYGEGGLFQETWAAYPVDRERSDELGEVFYAGDGGIDLNPPISWIYEFNFFLAFRDESIHLMRYRDVYSRMKLLFPYFTYDFNGKKLDIYPVTDGEHTYFAVPLIIRLDTENVPWSQRNPYIRLIGYAFVDVYNGDIKLHITEDDFYCQLFKKEYADYVETELPDWFKYQARYPEELFEWQINMYNYYHVTDASTFIVGKEFFEVPEGTDTYFIVAKPPGFDKPEFIGLDSLELRGARGRNLAGYMVVRNDIPHLGELIFYEVPLDSETKLLGPTGALEALEKNSEFAQLRTLLRTPRIGDIIIYRLGDYDVYFIPVYTSTAGGVVTETGVIACVGAAFGGEYHVGLGANPEDALVSFVEQLTGIEDIEDIEDEKPLKVDKSILELVDQANEHLENFKKLWGEGDFEGAGRELQKFMELWEEIAERSGEEY